MVYAQPNICPGEWDTQTPMGFWHTNESPNLSQTTRSYNNQQKKKMRTCKIVDFAVPADHRVKLKERDKKEKCLDLVRGLKKLWNMKVMFILIVIGTLGTVTKGLIKGLEVLEIRGDHSNYCILEIGPNTEKSPGDLRRLAVTQTSVKDHHLTLMWKTLKE